MLDASVGFLQQDGGIKNMMKISETWFELLALFPWSLGGQRLVRPVLKLA
jgi:hypothetical protein